MALFSAIQFSFILKIRCFRFTNFKFHFFFINAQNNRVSLVFQFFCVLIFCERLASFKIRQIFYVSIFHISIFHVSIFCVSEFFALFSETFRKLSFKILSFFAFAFQMLLDFLSAFQFSFLIKTMP